MNGNIGQIVDFSHFFVNFKAYELPLNIKDFVQTFHNVFFHQMEQF